jgi:hypothetical protein
MLYYMLLYSVQNPGCVFLFLSIATGYLEALRTPKHYFSENTLKIWRKMNRMIRFQIAYDLILYLYWIFQNANSLVKRATGGTDIAGAFFQSTSHYYLVIGPIIRCGFALWYARINDRERREQEAATSSVQATSRKQHNGVSARVE